MTSTDCYSNYRLNSNNYYPTMKTTGSDCKESYHHQQRTSASPTTVAAWNDNDLMSFASPPTTMKTTTATSHQGAQAMEFPPHLSPITPTGSTISSYSSQSEFNTTRTPSPTHIVAPRSTPESVALVPQSHNNNKNKNRQLVPHINVPRSRNPLGTDAVHPEKFKMKAQRKRRMAGGAVGGMVVGGLVLGPVGVFLGGAAGTVATKKICKAGEKRAQRKFEQSNVQKSATRNAAIHHGFMA